MVSERKVSDRTVSWLDRDLTVDVLRRPVAVLLPESRLDFPWCSECLEGKVRPKGRAGDVCGGRVAGGGGGGGCCEEETVL